MNMYLKNVSTKCEMVLTGSLAPKKNGKKRSGHARLIDRYYCAIHKWHSS